MSKNKLHELRQSLIKFARILINNKEHEGIDENSFEKYATELLAYCDDIEAIMVMYNISYEEYFEYATAKMCEIKI